jgi:hypothetical protein
MKLDAADEGAPVRMQTVGSRTVRPSMKPRALYRIGHQLGILRADRNFHLPFRV